MLSLCLSPSPAYYSTHTHLGKPDVERGAGHDAVLVLNHHDVQSATGSATRGHGKQAGRRAGVGVRGWVG